MSANLEKTYQRQCPKRSCGTMRKARTDKPREPHAIQSLHINAHSKFVQLIYDGLEASQLETKSSIWQDITPRCIHDIE